MSFTRFKGRLRVLECLKGHDLKIDCLFNYILSLTVLSSGFFHTFVYIFVGVNIDFNHIKLFDQKSYDVFIREVGYIYKAPNDIGHGIQIWHILSVHYPY